MHAIPLFRSNAIAKTDWMPILGGIVITIVVNVTYFSARNIGFWSDDYAFIEVAARLSFLENLIWYFDPRLQFLWYRPIPGMLWWIEWQLFRNNPLGYHLVYVLIHLANCLLLYAIVARVLRNWLSGFASALVYAGISVYSHAVLRPSDETALAVLFYLLTILFWIHFLLKQNWRLYVCAYLFFVLALFSKEASVTLPVMLFLVDRLLVGSKAAINLLVRRYLPLLLILIPYLAFELALAPNTLYKTNLGYGLGVHIFSILGEYLTRLVFPWGLDLLLNYVWLSLVLLGIVYLIIQRRDRRWLFWVIGMLMTLAPYVPFQFVFPRFLYLPMMFPAIAIGGIAAWLHMKFASRHWHTVLVASGLVGIVMVNGLQTMREIVALEHFAHELRVPLRTISQRHPTFPPDAFLYFIDPPVPLYSGMFFLKYGSQVSVGGDIGVYDSLWKNVPPKPAGLCDHNTAYVFYFDESGELKEPRTSCNENTISEPMPPVDFESSIQLEGYEIVSSQVKQGEDLFILLYWRTQDRVIKDYTVFAHLLDRYGNIVAGADSQPRNGKARTSSWRIRERVVDWRIIPVPKEVPPGSDYVLAIGLYDYLTMQRLGIIDANGHVFSDRVIIRPITILE